MIPRQQQEEEEQQLSFFARGQKHLLFIPGWLKKNMISSIKTVWLVEIFVLFWTDKVRNFVNFLQKKSQKNLAYFVGWKLTHFKLKKHFSHILLTEAD